jgi:ribosomal protein L24
MTNRQLYLSHVAQTIATPLALEIERAEGIYLYGPEGEKYIDAISGISVSNVGHCHPHVVNAIKEQAAKYMHLMVYGEYIYTPQVKLCEKLVSVLPSKLNNVYLVNSGAEATEGAIKLVKRYTGRSKLISFNKSYHGSTNGALSLMGYEYFKEMYRPLLPDTRQLIVEGINMRNKRLKPNQENPNPGLVSEPAAIDSSKVSHVDPRTGLRTKIAYMINSSGEKIRVSKKTGEPI